MADRPALTQHQRIRLHALQHDAKQGILTPPGWEVRGQQRVVITARKLRKGTIGRECWSAIAHPIGTHGE